MTVGLLLLKEKVMNNYRKTSINHPLPGLFILNTFWRGGGAYLREEAYLI